MEAFLTIKVLLRYLGLMDFAHPYGKLFNAMVCIFGLFSTTFVGTASLLYVFLAAEQFADRGEAIVASNVGFGNLAMYLLLQLYRQPLLSMIAQIEGVIEASM